MLRTATCFGLSLGHHQVDHFIPYEATIQ